jgi:hypothetical protein
MPRLEGAAVVAFKHEYNLIQPKYNHGKKVYIER